MKEENLFSFSRELMTKRCLREFYLHAHYAFGEYDADSADSERNHVHLLKQLKSAENFKAALISEIFHHIFIKGSSFSDFKRALMHKFFCAKDDMLLGNYFADHLAGPILYSFHYEETNFGEMFTVLHNELETWCRGLSANDLLNRLFAQERQNFYPVENVAFINLGRIKIHFPLLGIIKLDNDYYFLNLSNDTQYFETSQVLHLVYADHNLHIDPQYVKHIFINEKNHVTLIEDNYNINISAILNNIAERAANLAAVTAGMADIYSPFAISNSGSKEICSCCRFKEFCRE